jgi:hypothetical protein
MRPADPSLSLAERVDAACDHFEAEWKAGRRPQIKDYLAAAPESDRAVLRQALLAVERELQGRKKADTSARHSGVRSGNERQPVMTTPYAGPPAEVPATVGRFEVRGLLGAGAFGRVYRAYDPHLGREVALKVPLEEAVKTDGERSRFLKEARAAATINHPNVCQIHEVGEHGGRPYIVMALVPGQSLADVLKARKAPLPDKQVAQVVRKVALALAVAHGKGIVHRDLKPANVMFDRERKDIVVMDFGLARGPRFGDARATQSGVIMGTPAYMSPEQASGGSKDVGPAADVFSLGVILYELLTGTRPYSGTVTEVLGQILHVEPEPPSKRRPGVHPQLEAVCLKALAKDPAARFADMKEMAAAMDAFLRAPLPAAETAGAGETRHEKGATSTNLAEVFAALSVERKAARAETAAAVEAAVRKHRTPPWVLALVGLVFLGGLTALAAVVFFTRPDKVKVTIELTDVDLSDKTLSFFLDDAPIAAEALAQPVELKPGEHVLVVKRGQEIVKRVLLTVSGGRNPGLKVKDSTPPPPADESEYERLSRGEWKPFCKSEADLAPLVVGGTVGKEVLFHDGQIEVRARKPEMTLVFGPTRATSVAVRGRFKRLPGERTTVVVRADWPQRQWGYNVYFDGKQGFGIVRIGPPALYFPGKRVQVPENEEFEYLVVADGPRLTSYINGQPAAFWTDSEFWGGQFGLVVGGHLIVRGLEYRVLPDRPIPPANGYATLFNSRDLHGLTVTQGARDQWRVEQGALVGDAGAGSTALVTLPRALDRFHLEYRLEPGASAVATFDIGENESWSLALGPVAGGSAPGGQALEPGDLPWALSGRNGVRRAERPARLKPAGEWNQLQVDLDEQHVTAWINGGLVNSFWATAPEFQALWHEKKPRPGMLLLSVPRGRAAFRGIEFRPYPDVAGGEGRLPRGRAASRGLEYRPQP